ncbi:MAG: molybdopterin molybdotransferase MoeA, partial [Eubacteriales bacterium]
MLNVTGYTQTIQRLQDELKFLPVETEILPIAKALGRTLAQDIQAEEDIPPYDRSVMDGFAVRAADTFGAGASLPVMMEIAGEVGMGEYVTTVLQKGRAFRISTGGMLPPGADGVVMIEYTEELDANTVLIEKSISPGENIIRKGEDIKIGENLFLKGHVLRPQDIGAMAALGVCAAAVYKPMRIGIVSTGNEIVNPAEKMQPGKIRDINTYALAAAIEKDGFLPKTYEIVPDEFNELKNMLVLALQENDAVLISGGSSVGVMDMTLKVIDSIHNSKILIEGIALKPGKPTIAALVNQKPVFGLPGHPVSAFIVYHTVIAPVM